MSLPSGRKPTNRRLWGEITYDEWCAALNQMLSQTESEAISGGTIWIVRDGEDTAIASLLYALAEKAGYEEPWEETDYDEAVDWVKEHFMQDNRTAVFCEVGSHMTSGAWGLGQFISGDRGYFYRIAEYGVGDDEGEAIPILSAWAPAHDAQVYEEAFLKTYVEHWGFGLPPQLGKWAEGPPKLMTKAIATVLAKEPGMWTTVLGKLKEADSALPHEGIITSIAKETGVPEASVLAAHKRFVTDYDRLSASVANGQADDTLRNGLVALFWYALLIPEKRQLWETYPNTILEIGTDSKMVIDLRRPIVAGTQRGLKKMGFETAFAILTACNPPEHLASEEQNRRRTGELEGNVRALGVPFIQADGVSPDGTHREPGYAVAIPIETAQMLAKQFRQAAFFWFDGAQFWIVPVLAQAESMPLPIAN